MHTADLGGREGCAHVAERYPGFDIPATPARYGHCDHRTPRGSAPACWSSTASTTSAEVGTDNSNRILQIGWLGKALNDPEQADKLIGTSV